MGALQLASKIFHSPFLLECSRAHRHPINLGNLWPSSETFMVQTSESNSELADILNRFDPSAKGKFDRSAHIEWCNEGNHEAEDSSTCQKSIPRNLASRILCSKSNFVSRVAKKLESMKIKLQRNRRSSKRAEKRRAFVSEQITHGSDTPASSRPSSISMTMDQIENLRRKMPSMVSSEGILGSTANPTNNV